MSKPPYIYLAPFQGITSAVYREVYTKHFDGVDKLFTPFFTAIHSQKSLAAKVGELEKPSHFGVPVIPQVLSNDADEIIRFNQICFKMGFNEVNWNMGCPFRKVASKKRGSGLMQYPDLVNGILEKTMSSAPLKFSIKCRLGYESSGEIIKMLDVFNKYPLSELIVHARIGRQIYKGGVDLVTFEQILTKAEAPLVYNGDVFEAADFNNLKSKFKGIDSWMIGRGLLIDPLLPADIKGFYQDIDTCERKLIVRKFIEDLYYQYRKKLNDRLHAISLMKELWGYMAYSFDKPGKVFGVVKKTKSFDEYEDAVKSIFDDHKWVGAKAGQFESSMH